MERAWLRIRRAAILKRGWHGIAENDKILPLAQYYTWQRRNSSLEIVKDDTLNLLRPDQPSRMFQRDKTVGEDLMVRYQHHLRPHMPTPLLHRSGCANISRRSEAGLEST